MNADSHPAAPRLRERLRAETRASILAAAEAVLTGNPAAGSMERIAAQAGVAVGTLYNHFRDREALLAALIDDRCAELVRNADAALDRAAGFEPRLRAFVAALLAHFHRHRRFLALVAGGEGPAGARHTPPLAPSPVFLALIERAERLVAEGVRERALRREIAALAPQALVGMIRGVLIAEMRAPAARAPDAVARRLVDLFLHGVARPRGGR